MENLENSPDEVPGADDRGPARRKKWKSILRKILFALLGVSLFLGISGAGLWIYYHPELQKFERLVYGHRDGRELVMHRCQPENPNGKGVIVLNSGRWKSNPDRFRLWYVAPLLRTGFTVFVVSHISQPEVTIMDTAEDVERAVRYVRHRATDFEIDPAAIGISGGSSGGHLSLCVATMADDGEQGAEDPVDRVSSRVQAVAVFFPVTDLLNLGPSTENPGDGGPPINFVRGFGPGVEDLKHWKKVGRDISPIYHLDDPVPPTLIYHGDADTLVPLEQSTRYKKVVETNGAGSVKLVVRKGKKHGWLAALIDIHAFVNWHERHLRRSDNSL